MIQQVKAYLELCKINLSLFSALSAVTGLMLAHPSLTAETFEVAAGVFLLACGACALNQYQERRTDALMDRTKKRSVPSGRIKPFYALYFAIAILGSGFLIIAFTGSLPAFFVSFSAFVLYNGVYTYLKKKTAFASVPCAVIGALLPAIGWFAGGGEFPYPKILALCSFFYIWQLAHFWLLFLSNGADYKKAGLPSLTDVFSQKQLLRIVFIWILATAVACMLTLLYKLIISFNLSVLLFFITLWLIRTGIKMRMEGENTFSYHSVFKKINIYILLFMLLINIDRMMNQFYWFH
jgi:protoheme IX farnesyltransferase